MESDSLILSLLRRFPSNGSPRLRSLRESPSRPQPPSLPPPSLTVAVSGRGSRGSVSNPS